MRIRPYKSIVIKRDERHGEATWKPTLVCDMIDRCQFSGRITIRYDPPTAPTTLVGVRAACVKTCIYIYRKTGGGEEGVKQPVRGVTSEARNERRREREKSVRLEQRGDGGEKRKRWKYRGEKKKNE